MIIRVESSWTHDALLNDTDSLDWTTNNDILQYVVGIDRPHFIRFLNPDDSFFTSFQVFETYYPGAHSSNGGKDGLITGVSDSTFTAFTQTHYYRDQIIPLIFATFGTEGTDSTIGGNTEWLITDHGFGQCRRRRIPGQVASAQHRSRTRRSRRATRRPKTRRTARTIFGPAHMQAGGAQRNKDDEFCDQNSLPLLVSGLRNNLIGCTFKQHGGKDMLGGSEQSGSVGAGRARQRTCTIFRRWR